MNRSRPYRAMRVLLVALVMLRCATTDIESPSDPVNQAPVANDDQTTTSQGVPVTVTVTANDTDPDGNRVQLTDATLVTSVPGGSITIDADRGSITVNPGPSFVGTIEITYGIADDGTPPRFAEGTLRVTVVAGTAPVATDDQAATEQGVPVTVDVLENDTDAEDGPLQIAGTVFLGTQPPGASVQINSDQTLTIDPGPGFTGTFDVGYTVRDPTGLEDAGKVTVTVTAPGSGTSVRVHIVDDTGDPLGGAFGAFRIGLGMWMPLGETTPGQFDFDVPTGEIRWGFKARYQDASQTIEATTNEATSARMTFRDANVAAVDFGFSWNGVDDIATATPAVTLYGLGGYVAMGGGPSGASTVPQYLAHPQDFVMVATSNGIAVGADIFRNVTPMQAEFYDFTFTAANQGGSASVSSFTTPGGIVGEFLVRFTTGASMTPVGAGTNGGGVAYTIPASEVDLDDDYYVATGAASTSGAVVTHTTVSRPPLMGASFDLPNNFYFVNPPVASANPTFTDLDTDEPDHQAFVLTVGHSGSDPAITRQIFITQGWLQEAQGPPPAAARAVAVTTSYTVDDPTGLPGFEDFGFTGGDMVTWTVTQVSNNMPLGDVLNAALSAGVPLIDGLSQTTATAAGVYMVQ